MISKQTLEKFLFVTLLIIHLVPIWAFPYFVTLDGPAHVDNAAALRNYLQPGQTVLQEYYTLNLRLVPNWFTNIALASLMGIVSPLTAEKIVISAYVLLLPLSVRYALAGISERVVYLSALSFPVIYNCIFHYGFYNFLFSIVMFFFALGYWLRYRDSLRLRNILTLSSLILVLYFCHGTSLLLLILTLFILALSLSLHATPITLRDLSNVLNSWRVFRNRIWIPLIIGVAPALFLLSRFVFQQGSPPIWPRYSDWLFWAWPFYGVTATTNHLSNLLISMSVSLLFLALFLYVLRGEATKGGPPLRKGLLITAATAGILYVISPYTIAGGTIVNPRFILFALLLGILFFGTYEMSDRVKLRVGIASAVLAITQLVLNIPVYAQINRDAAEYMSAAASIEPNTTLGALCFAEEGCGPRTGHGYMRVAPFNQISGYLSAQRQAVNLLMVDPRTNYFPIQYREGLDSFSYMRYSEVRDKGEYKRIYGKKIADYAPETGGHIDYVLLWQVADAQRAGDDVTDLFRWLSVNYDRVFTSVSGRLDVYRRKEGANHEIIGTK